MSNDLKMTTRGEWIVSQLNDGRIAVVAIKEDSTQKVIAVTGMVGGDDENEAIANAALMAVAPQMLDVLIEVQNSLAQKLIDIDAIMELIAGPEGIYSRLANEAGEDL
jgi:hypothetical protein